MNTSFCVCVYVMCLCHASFPSARRELGPLYCATCFQLAVRRAECAPAAAALSSLSPVLSMSKGEQRVLGIC